MKITKRNIFFIFSCLFLGIGLWLIGMNSYRLFHTPDSEGKNNTTKTNEINQNITNSIYQRAPRKGEVIGQLIIPKINANLPIYEGADEDELVKGVGHYSHSVLPGEKDNAVLSGHRDTVFRKLGQMKKSDLLIVKTSAGQFKYKINKIRIVDADDRTVIVPKPRATLTVTTCYPFNFIGDAPERFILVADLIR